MSKSKPQYTWTAIRQVSDLRYWNPVTSLAVWRGKFVQIPDAIYYLKDTDDWAVRIINYDLDGKVFDVEVYQIKSIGPFFSDRFIHRSDKDGQIKVDAFIANMLLNDFPKCPEWQQSWAPIPDPTGLLANLIAINNTVDV